MFKAVAPPKNSVLECIKNFDVRGFMNHVKELNFNFIEITTFFAVGILGGFLCKRYFKSALVWALMSVVIVVVLDYIGMIAIQWDTIQGVVGASPAQTFDRLFEETIVWARDNVPAVISLIIGFTVGIKVG